jgi:FtsH-binding integral membrane protein
MTVYKVLRGMLATTIVCLLWIMYGLFSPFPKGYLFLIGEAGFPKLTPIMDALLAFLLSIFWFGFFRSEYAEKEDRRERFIEPITLGYLVGIVSSFLIEAFSGFGSLNLIFLILGWMVGVGIGLAVYINEPNEDLRRYNAGLTVTFWGIAILFAGIIHGWLFPYGIGIAFWIFHLASKKHEERNGWKKQMQDTTR